MFWTRPVVSFGRGAVITLGSTAVSCMFAIQVERSAHRLFFWMAPQWYAKVDHAFGLTEEDLQYARQIAHQQEIYQVGNLAHHFVFRYAEMADEASPQLWKSDGLSTTNAWKLRVPSDEDRILESAPL